MGTDSKSGVIIKAGARVFPSLGYHKTTVEDIIREAGVARSTFYVYFSSKREIFAHLVTELMSGMTSMTTAGIDDLVTRLGSPEGSRPSDAEIMRALVVFLADVFRYIEANRGMIWTFFNDLVVIDDEMTQLFRDFQANLTGEFQRLIRAGVEIGFLREVNQRRAADFIVAGLIHLARSISAGSGDYDIDEMSREIVDMQINGLRPAPALAGMGK